ncbi:hypothetical protein [Clostridium felsineum]|uniref:hypothetical protein n=1 Tax=Clostridium felsineum TaxID=36839 RepID=UPI0009D48F0C|nr:hypothetical protein [Clostridium felsineum]URZ15254.1 hypothetical protein CLFE_012720 [Clostridium felsineum DSM 794]
MDDITLVFPKEDLEVKAMEFKKEFFDFGERTINGSFKLDYKDNYAEWLKIT